MSTAESNPATPLVSAFEALAPSKQQAKKDKQHSKSKQRDKNKASLPPDEDPTKRPLNWPATIWLVLLHLGALSALFTFTWTGLITMLVLHWVTGCLGITLTYHRLLTHSSFQTYKPIRYLLAVIGGLAGEGSAIDWVANHRKHHALSDQPGDPHSPHDGAWWSHMWWLGYTLQGEAQAAHVRRWAPDLVKDKGMQFVGMMFLPIQFLAGMTLLGVGYYFGGWTLGLSLVSYGMFLRLVLVLHATWLVNSASHMWGYKNYETTDDSRNNWWVAIITYGEGWHNNHHAYPRMAPHGHKWWEFDITYNIIRLMKWTGLAWNVVDYKQKTLGSTEK